MWGNQIRKMYKLMQRRIHKISKHPTGRALNSDQFVNSFITRMHSSGMRTIRSSSHLSRGVCLSACWDTTPLGADTPEADTPKADTPADQAPPRLGTLPGADTPLETCCKACWNTTCNACWDSTSPPRPVARHAGIPPAMHAGIPPPPPETCCKACWDTTTTPSPPVDRHTPVKT